MPTMLWLGLSALSLTGAVCLAQQASEPGDQLAGLKRLYVDRFGGGESAAQIRDMVIASLQRSRLFVVTENPERAEAVLRGSAEDLVYTDVFQSGEGASTRSSVSAGRGTSARLRNYAALAGGASDNENTRIQERKHEASASVRIVAKDGDVLWSTTQESQGAKFRSASADVADKITRQLVADLGKRQAAAPAAGSPDH